MYGETAAQRKRSNQLREQASDLRAMADRLVSQADAVPWRGRAAEDLRERMRERAAHLRDAADDHETAADSLAAHAAEVDQLKEQIAGIEHRATGMIDEARGRIAAREHQDVRPGAPQASTAPDPQDDALVAFEAPPSGHADWLSVTLPGENR